RRQQQVRLHRRPQPPPPRVHLPNRRGPRMDHGTHCPQALALCDRRAMRRESQKAKGKRQKAKVTVPCGLFIKKSRSDTALLPFALCLLTFAFLFSEELCI